MRRLLLIASVMLLTTPVLAVTSEFYPPPPPPPFNTGEIFGGLGFGGFTSDLGNASNIGFAWMFRGGANFYRYFGAEVNYQGTSSGANTGIQNNLSLAPSNLTEQQITADAKIGFPVLLGAHVFRPYGFAGVGYANISSGNNLTIFGLVNQSAAAFPVGGGISFNVNPVFVIDARYTYNFLTESVGNSWNAMFNLGATIGG